MKTANCFQLPLLCILLFSLMAGCGPQKEGEGASVNAESGTPPSDAASETVSPSAEPSAGPPSADSTTAEPVSDTSASSDTEVASGNKRMLPPIPEQSEDKQDSADAMPDENSEPSEAEEEDLSAWNREGPLPEEKAAAAFLPPPGATPLSETSRLWIDRKRPRVYIDGYVAMKQGPLEMFACPVGTKEHESIVAVLARSRDVHAALLAVGAKPGKPVRFRPEFKPPTGQTIQVWACWYDKEGKFHRIDGRQWVQDLETEKEMKAEWVFAGSGFWKDPEDNQEFYQADSGDMICVSNFSSAMLDVAMASSAEADSLRFVPFEKNIPDRETPVRLVLVPSKQSLPDAPKTEPDDNIADVPEENDVPRAK